MKNKSSLPGRLARTTPETPETAFASGEAFAPLPPAARFGLTVGPPIGFGLILIITALLSGPAAAGFIASIAAGTFVAGGKLVILAGAIAHAPVGPWILAAVIVYVDVGTALIVLGGMHHLYRIPGAGRRIAAARESGWRVLQRNPWMYRATWLSLAGFIAVPFQGTGALVGAVIGRLMGLSRWSIIMATACGALFGSGILALAGDYWEERITAVAARPFLAFAVVLVFSAVTVVGSYWAFGRSHITGPDAGDQPGPSSSAGDRRSTAERPRTRLGA